MGIGFSWTGLLLAPLLAPALFSAVMVGLSGANSPILFLVLLVAGYVISLGSTVTLLLPCMFLLSRWRPVTLVNVCVLGLVLGAAVLVPVTWMEWKSSGADSGPPTESFFSFFPRWAADPFSAVYPFSGLVTAGLYWRLGMWRLRARLG